MKKINHSILPIKNERKKSVGIRVEHHGGWNDVRVWSEINRGNRKDEINRKIIELELKQTNSSMDEEYMHILEEFKIIEDLQKEKLYGLSLFSNKYYYLKDIKYKVPSCGIDGCWDGSPSKKKFKKMRQLCVDANYRQERGEYLFRYINEMEAEFVPCLNDIRAELLNGASMDVCDENGNNCLNVAMQRNFYLTFKMLIDAGVNINHVNYNGDTPLMFILKNNINYLYFTKILEAGANVSIVNKDGKTVLDIARELNNTYCINKTGNVDIKLEQRALKREKSIYRKS